MKEIVVISGKGGTGKTSITAALSYLGGKDVIVADCDVDAADMHLLMKPDFSNKEKFYSGYLARVDKNKCTNCDKCIEVCRFDAISYVEGKIDIDELNCEGCGYCAEICPEKAITLETRYVGDWYRSKIKTGGTMVHARLGIGAENSGKLVAKIKNEAKVIAGSEHKDIILIDGSPGIGCPVVSSLSGANYVVLVTEPTVSGLHDLKRVHQLVKKFSIPSGCIINKADLNALMTKQIKEYLELENISLIAELPYDETFTEAMVNGKTIVEYNHSSLKCKMIESWEKIK